VVIGSTPARAADRDRSIIGLITLAQLRGVTPSQRAATLVREAAIPLPRVPTATPHEPLTTLLERLGPDAGNRALVVDAGRLGGIVTASDLSRSIDAYWLASPCAGVAPGTDCRFRPPFWELWTLRDKVFRPWRGLEARTTIGPRVLARRALSAANVTFGRILEDVRPLAAQSAGVRWWRCRGNSVVCPEVRLVEQGQTALVLTQRRKTGTPPSGRSSVPRR